MPKELTVYETVDELIEALEPHRGKLVCSPTFSFLQQAHAIAADGVHVEEFKLARVNCVHGSNGRLAKSPDGREYVRVG